MRFQKNVYTTMTRLFYYQKYECNHKLYSILSRLILYEKLGLILEYFLYCDFFFVDKQTYEGIFGFYSINLCILFTLFIY